MCQGTNREIYKYNTIKCKCIAHIFYSSLYSCFKATCAIAVIYFLTKGTEKLFSKPTATRVYSLEVEPPAISLCHKSTKRRIANLNGLDFDNYAYDGKFIPAGFEQSHDDDLDDLFLDAYNDHYFLLDKTANVSHCKLVKEDGQYRRIYVGKVNETESGKPCLNWMTLNSTTANKYKTMMGIGDHNYCRNPGSAQNREFCYYSPTKWERCAARTCGKSKTAVYINEIRC